MTMQLPSEVHRTLSCSSCGHLISIGPVTKSSKGWLCGRCPNENGEQCLIYEALANGYLFPCKYGNYGCDVSLPFGEKMKEHEISCTKKPHICPTLPSQKCDWQGKYEDIEEHFKSSHKESVLKVLKVELDLKDEVKERRYAYFHKNKLVFLLDFLFNNDVELSIELIKVLDAKNDDTLLNEQYKVTFYHKDGISIFSRNLSSYSLNSNTLKTANNSSFDVFLLHYIGTADKKLTISFDVELPTLQPPPPSVSTVKQSDTTNNENNYVCACKNHMNGCGYTDFYETVLKHEQTCFIYNCPLQVSEACNWRGIMSAITKHCLEKHRIARNSLCVNLKDIVLRGQTDNYYLFASSFTRTGMSFFEELFRVYIKLENHKTKESVIRIIVEYIGEASNDDTYGFDVHFTNNLGLSNATDKKFDCVPFIGYPSRNMLKSGVSFSYQQFRECTVRFTINRKRRRY